MNKISVMRQKICIERVFICKNHPGSVVFLPDARPATDQEQFFYISISELFSVDSSALVEAVQITDEKFVRFFCKKRACLVRSEDVEKIVIWYNRVGYL